MLLQHLRAYGISLTSESFNVQYAVIHGCPVIHHSLHQSPSAKGGRSQRSAMAREYFKRRIKKQAKVDLTQFVS
jgi:hypothetical protein